MRMVHSSQNNYYVTKVIKNYFSPHAIICLKRDFCFVCLKFAQINDWSKGDVVRVISIFVACGDPPWLRNQMTRTCTSPNDRKCLMFRHMAWKPVGPGGWDIDATWCAAQGRWLCPGEASQTRDCLLKYGRTWTYRCYVWPSGECYSLLLYNKPYELRRMQ